MAFGDVARCFCLVPHAACEPAAIGKIYPDGVTQVHWLSADRDSTYKSFETLLAIPGIVLNYSVTFKDESSQDQSIPVLSVLGWQNV
jgi:hypothetical protein